MRAARAQSTVAPSARPARRDRQLMGRTPRFTRRWRPPVVHVPHRPRRATILHARSPPEHQRRAARGAVVHRSRLPKASADTPAARTRPMTLQSDRDDSVRRNGSFSECPNLPASVRVSAALGSIYARRVPPKRQLWQAPVARHGNATRCLAVMRELRRNTLSAYKRQGASTLV